MDKGIIEDFKVIFSVKNKESHRVTFPLLQLKHFCPIDTNVFTHFYVWVFIKQTCFPLLPLSAHQQAGWLDSSSWWHSPSAFVDNDKIKPRGDELMSWWGNGGALYLRVTTLTNFPMKLRSECSACVVSTTGCGLDSHDLGVKIPKESIHHLDLCVKLC